MISEIQAVQSTLNSFDIEFSEIPASGSSESVAFAPLVELNNDLQSAASISKSFATGDDVNLHDVLIQMKKVELEFTLAVEVRNKLVDAYQQIMRMQL